MSMFDGLSDALNSVPPNELRFSFSEIECFIRMMSCFQDYLDERKEDEQPFEYASDGRQFSEILSDLWNKIMNYKFH